MRPLSQNKIKDEIYCRFDKKQNLIRNIYQFTPFKNFVIKFYENFFLLRARISLELLENHCDQDMYLKYKLDVKIVIN